MFFIFHFGQLWIFNSEFAGLFRHRPGRASSTVKNPKLLEMKNKTKTFRLFLFQQYGKFWSVSLDNIIEHKPLISEELGDKHSKNHSVIIYIGRSFPQKKTWCVLGEMIGTYKYLYRILIKYFTFSKSPSSTSISRYFREQLESSLVSFRYSIFFISQFRPS